MTSMPSRDDLEQELWKAGIRDRAAVTRILRVHDLIVVSAARPAPPGDYAVPDLAPGEYDLARAVICCKSCGMTKHVTLFPKEKTLPAGYLNVCRTCADGPKPRKERDPGQLITCRDCGTTRAASGNYYSRPDNATGYALVCKDCSPGSRVCGGCGRKRRPRLLPRNQVLCLDCRESRGE